MESRTTAAEILTGRNLGCDMCGNREVPITTLHSHRSIFPIRACEKCLVAALDSVRGDK